MRLAVTRRQSDPRAARERIGIRRSFTTQVRQKYQPFTSRGHSSRLVNQLRKISIARELVAIPLQTAGGAEHHSHQMPATCDSMTKRVQPSLGFNQRRLGSGENNTRSSKR